MQGSDALVTFIEGSWRVEDGQLFISRVKAAGKPLPEPECGQWIISATEDTIVLRGTDAQNKTLSVTYKRIR